MALDRPIIEKNFYIEPKEAEFYLNENYLFDHNNPQAKLQSEFRQQNRDVISDYSRFSSTFKLNGRTVNAVKETLLLNGKTLTTISVSFNKQKALEISAAKMIDLIEAEMPNIHKPRFIIGLPNYRGQCYFGPIFVPLFNNHFFIQALREAFDKSSEYLYKTGDLKPESYRNQTINKDCAFLFVRIIKQFYNKYKKASLEAELNIENWPTLAREKSQNTNDLIVDRALMKIVIELANKEDSDYKTPGGYGFKLYTDITKKLASDFHLIPMVSPFHRLFFTQIDFEYTCFRCNNTSMRRRFEASSILIPDRHPEFKSVQDYLDHIEDLIYYQDWKCNRFTTNEGENMKCGDEMVNIRRVKVIQAPEILVFQIRPNLERKNTFCLELPENLKFPYKGRYKKYEKFAYSFNYPLYNRNGVLKSHRYTEKEPEDKESSYHAITMIKSPQGWFEINNHLIYEPNFFMKNAKAFEIVYYQLVIGETDIFLPNIGNYYTDDGEKIVS